MDPALLFIIIFIVAPIVERLLKAKKQAPPPPPQQRPGRERPPMPRPRPEESRPQLPRAEQPDDDARAAEMLPDDLWEILTGQRRERPAPPPRQELPEPVAAEQRSPAQPRRPRPGIVRKPTRPPAEPERVGRMQTPARRPAPARVEAAADEETQLRVEAPREQYPVEGYVREIPVHRAPEIVSLEELVIDDEKRHASFHQRISTFKTSEVRRGKRHRISTLLRQSDHVRQAMVLSEVLGNPKGMQ